MEHNNYVPTFTSAATPATVPRVDVVYTAVNKSKSKGAKKKTSLLCYLCWWNSFLCNNACMAQLRLFVWQCTTNCSEYMVTSLGSHNLRSEAAIAPLQKWHVHTRTSKLMWLPLLWGFTAKHLLVYASTGCKHDIHRWGDQTMQTLNCSVSHTEQTEKHKQSIQYVVPRVPIKSRGEAPNAKSDMGGL